MGEQNQSVLVVGNSIGAMLTALLLHQRQVPVRLLSSQFHQVPPTQTPECLPLGGNDAMPALFQHSLKQWRQIPEILQLPELTQAIMAYDVANTPGREITLQQEALLDALVGENMLYQAGAPEGWNAGSMLGHKVWASATALHPNVVLMLRKKILEQEIPVTTTAPTRLSLVPLEVTLQDGQVLGASHIVLACGKTAKSILSRSGINVPLRPARTHVLNLPWGAENSAQIWSHRLHYGHFMAHTLKPEWLQIFYDGICDPLQATASQEVSAEVVNAMLAHAKNLLGSRWQAQAEAQAEVQTHYVCPDYRPALGAWKTQPKLIFSLGWGAREGAYAAAAAEAMAEYIITSENGFPEELQPNRFANGMWHPAKKPSSLQWEEPQQAASMHDMRTEKDYMENIQSIESKKVEYASTVQPIEKQVHSATHTAKTEIRERSSKPRVQMGSVRNI